MAGITNARLRSVVLAAIERGWEASWTGKQHVRLRHPNGAVVFCPGTPSSDLSAVKTERLLRRKEQGAAPP